MDIEPIISQLNFVSPGIFMSGLRYQLTQNEKILHNRPLWDRIYQELGLHPIPLYHDPAQPPSVYVSSLFTEKEIPIEMAFEIERHTVFWCEYYFRFSYTGQLRLKSLFNHSEILTINVDSVRTSSSHLFVFIDNRVEVYNRSLEGHVYLINGPNVLDINTIYEREGGFIAEVGGEYYYLLLESSGISLGERIDGLPGYSGYYRPNGEKYDFVPYPSYPFDSQLEEMDMSITTEIRTSYTPFRTERPMDLFLLYTPIGYYKLISSDLFYTIDNLIEVKISNGFIISENKLYDLVTGEVLFETEYGVSILHVALDQERPGYIVYTK